MQELSNAQSAVNVDVASPPIEFVEEAVADTSEPHSGISGTAMPSRQSGSALTRLKPRCFAGGGILGVAAMWLPHDVRQGFAPLAKSTVRGVYRIGQKSKELIADVQEQIQDIVAEVDAENARA